MIDTQNTTFYSTSMYRHEAQSSAIAPHQSMGEISASNFAMLNSEGGACYHPSAIATPRRAGRPSGGATGSITWESPVGDVPWILMAVFVLVYAIRKRQKASAK